MLPRFQERLYKTLCSHKGGFFAWEVWWGKLRTLDVLKGRGRAPANSFFFLLSGEGESIERHILICYFMVRELWTLLFAALWLGSSKENEKEIH